MTEHLPGQGRLYSSRKQVVIPPLTVQKLEAEKPGHCEVFCPECILMRNCGDHLELRL